MKRLYKFLLWSVIAASSYAQQNMWIVGTDNNRQKYDAIGQTYVYDTPTTESPISSNLFSE